MEIEQGGNSSTNITTLYRADGSKLKKINTTTTTGIVGYSTTIDTTDYLDGFQYLESKKISDAGTTDGDLEMDFAMEREAFTKEESKTAAIAPPGGGGTDNSFLHFFPTAEGFFDFVENKYIYQYKDHLGNTRLSFAKNQTTQSAEVLDKNDYYPFGMNHLDSNAGSFFGQSSYKNYKYNGKELQETGFYDYGWRQYMPDIARWMAIDPMAEKMRRFSPYNYAWDNPIMFVDYDGMFATPPDDYIDASTGKYLGSDGAATKNVRVIYKSDWNNITSENGGSLSTTATTALQASSSVVTVNNAQINSDINNANNETIADQTAERQVYVGIEVTRGDVPTAQVTSARGPDGTDGKTVITMAQRGDASGNLVKQTFEGTKLLPTAQVHTHNTSQNPTLTNVPGTSSIDVNTSSSSTGFNIPVYAVDSYTGAQPGGNAIHRVMPNGTQTNNVGTTTSNSIGQESLNNFVDKQKTP